MRFTTLNTFKIKNYIKHTIAVLLLVVVIFPYVSQAQEHKLIMDKPGTFTIVDNGVYGESIDSYYKACKYSTDEQRLNRQKLDNLVSVFRQTPMLADPKGFDEVVTYLHGGCDSKFGYGIPATVKFSFQDWFSVNGKVYHATDEPPQWMMEVNQLTAHYGNGNNYINSVANPPTNPAYNQAKREEIALKLNELFYPSGKKEPIAEGIDRYGDMLVFYNPDRPEYWKQVTIRQVFELIFEFTGMDPDMAAVEPVMQIMKAEYNRFSEAQKNSFAYFGNPETISRIGTDNRQLPVLTPNPEYWSRGVPRTSIQFMTMEIPPKEEVKRLMDEYLQNQDGTYYEYLMMYQLDIISLNKLIEK